MSFWFSLLNVSVGVNETIELLKTIVGRYILLVKGIGVLNSMSIKNDNYIDMM